MEVSNSGSLMNQSSVSLKMRELIEAINEYIGSKTDSSAFIINKFLQAYSVIIDASVFDPENGISAQFYVSLYNLFTNLEPNSQIAWYCVDVLCNACRNISARQALKNTYQFVPILSRLLCDQLSHCKRKKILLLLQDLTCGIKLSWQVSNLPHLLKTLTKWVEEMDQEIVCLSLSVLVNLCFKNLSVVFTLSRIIDIKKFIRFCLPLQGPVVEIHVCKLMVALNHLDDNIPKNTMLHLVSPTFKSIQDALSKNEPVMLRSAIDFFVDIITPENREVFREYEHFTEELDELIKSVNAGKIQSNSDATPITEHDPECIMLVLKFIYALESNKLDNFSKLYRDILTLALDWMHLEMVSSQANLLMTIITQNIIEISDTKNNLELLSSKLPTLLNILHNESAPANMEGCKRLGSLLQLLRTMLKANSISNEVLTSLKEQSLKNIFTPVLSEDFNVKNLPLLKVNENITSSTEYVDAYIYGISLVYELAQHDAVWLETLSMLMENKNIQSILAIALYGSKSNIRQLVLELSRYSRFPIAKIATAMDSSRVMFSISKYPTSVQNNIATPHNLVSPILGYNQLEMIDETLKNVKRQIQDQNINNLSVCQVIELYEYKLTSLANSELSAINNLESASERCVHLQHRLAQISSEHNKLGQLIHHYENRLEKSNKSMNDLQTFCLEERKKADADVSKWEKFMQERENKIQEIQEELLQMTEHKNNLEEQIKKLQNLIEKLEENGNKTEKQLQSREQQLKNANTHITDLNVQIKDLRKTLDQQETKLNEVTKHYIATKEVLNTITKVATSQINSERPVL